ncbi:MAG: hypothetical protein ACOCW8_00595 [bacterium]
MRKNILNIILIFGVLFTGCSKYQFVFVEQRYPQNSTEPNFIDADSIKINYNFAGNNMPVKIRIFNDSEKSLYFDLKKSSAIIGGEKVDYWKQIENRIVHIPPKSYINKNVCYLGGSFNLKESDAEFRNVSFSGPTGTYHARLYDFKTYNTPLTFRSYLTFSSSENFENEVAIDKEFYVPAIVESYSKNISFDPQVVGYGDNSVLTERTDFSKGIGYIAIVGLIGLYLASL